MKSKLPRDANETLYLHLSKIFQLTSRGIYIYSRSKTKVIFCPEANAFLEHHHYIDYIRNNFRDITLVTLKEDGKYPGIRNTASMTFKMVMEIEKMMTLDMLAISTAFFTNSYRDKNLGIKLSPSEMLDKFEREMKGLEKKYHKNKRYPDKDPVCVVTGKSGGNYDDLCFALIMVTFGINVFFSNKYKEYH